VSKILRLPAVIKKTGISRTTIYRLLEKEEFPKPFPITGRAVGWSDEAINKWIDEKINQGKDEVA